MSNNIRMKNMSIYVKCYYRLFLFRAILFDQPFSLTFIVASTLTIGVAVPRYTSVCEGTPSDVLFFSNACFRKVRGDTWKGLLQGMQTSSEHITETSQSRSRSYAAVKQMLPPECPTLNSPPVIHSPFTCLENTR